jgi:biofilm PGA synthesis N-glycosyltransferase PgaC
MKWVFLGSVALLLYTYIGYPVHAWVLARLFPKPIRSTSDTPDVVVVLVVYNEARRILAKIHTCLQQDYPPERLTILVVSDGSTDGTNDIVKSVNDDRVKLLAFPERRGKPACINDAVAHTQAPIIVLSDARQRLDPQAVSRLLATFGDPSVGVVSGELLLEGETTSPFAYGIGAYWRYETFIRKQEALSGSVVGVTGAFCALRRECFVPIPEGTILDDVAIPMQAAVRDWRVAFARGAWAFDAASPDAKTEKIRKVRTLAGNFQMISLFPVVLNPFRNPVWGRFVAHKLLRLICPVVLAVALVSHLALALEDPGIMRVTAMFHVGAYVCALAVIALPALQRIKFLSLVATFTYLNIFTVLGFIAFVTGRQSQRWAGSTDDARPS